MELVCVPVIVCVELAVFVGVCVIVPDNDVETDAVAVAVCVDVCVGVRVGVCVDDDVDVAVLEDVCERVTLADRVLDKETPSVGVTVGEIDGHGAVVAVRPFGQVLSCAHALQNLLEFPLRNPPQYSPEFGFGTMEHSPPPEERQQ